MSELVHLVPIAGRFINGIPAVEHDCDPATAAAEVASGAFRYAHDAPATAAPKLPVKPQKE